MRRKNFNEYKIDGDIVKIILYDKNKIKYFCLIDKEDLQKLIDLNIHWHLEWNKYTQSYYVKSTYYIIENKNKITKTLRLHNFLLNTSPYQRIDHINHNTLDNRKENIRLATIKQNSRNRQGLNSNNTSGYRNVTNINGYWRVQLQINGKNTLFLNKFENVHLAGKFAEEMRQKYYKEFSGNQ